MSPIHRPIHHRITSKVAQAKHLIMGYVFLTLVFIGVLTSVYYWEFKANANHSNAPKHVGSGEQSAGNGENCSGGITRARQIETGEIREFPSPCHVLKDSWIIIK